MISHIYLFSAVFLVVLVLLWAFLRKRSSNDLSSVPGSQVYVGNLAYKVDEDALAEYFGQYGAFASIRVIRNRKTGRSKGFAFVTYRDAADAQSALRCHGQEFAGRSLVVRIAKPRPNDE